jgi:hypothetical protein
MLLHLFYCVVWFWFLFDLNSKSIFKMALETNLNEKRKEKEKRNLTCAAGGLEACPSRPALLYFAVGPSEAELLCPLFPTPAWAGLGAVATPRSLPCFTDERTPHVSHTPSSSRRDRAGDEHHRNRIHRGNRDFYP